MAEVARLQVVIGARINEFNKEMGALQKNVKRTFASDNLGISKGAVGAIVGVGVALGALGLASVKAAGQMEQTRIAFTTLLKDGEKAKSFLSELENLRPVRHLNYRAFCSLLKDCLLSDSVRNR